MTIRNRPHSRSVALAAFIAVFLVACPGALDANADGVDVGAPARRPPEPAACPNVPSAVLGAGCGSVGCHGAASPAAGLDLASADVGRRLAGKMALNGGLLVNPAAPLESVLYARVGPRASPSSRMPIGSAPLDDATLACLASWIADQGRPASGAGTTPSSAGEPADAAPSGWTPAALQNAVIWLDADEGVTSTGARVSAWRDRSPKHNDAAQGADSNRPSLAKIAINGHAALTFEESRQTFLTIADAASLRWGTGGFAIAVVAANRKATTGRGHGRGVSTVFAKPQQNAATEVTLHLNWFTAETTDDDGRVHVGVGEGNPGQESATGGTNDGKARAYIARVMPDGAGSTYELFINGKAAGKTRAAGAVDVTLAGSPIRIGSTYGQSVEGDVAEVVAVGGLLVDADLAKLTAYLVSKYGLTP